VKHNGSDNLKIRSLLKTAIINSFWVSIHKKIKHKTGNKRLGNIKQQEFHEKTNILRDIILYSKILLFIYCFPP